MHTARDGVGDRVQGLDLGADDSLVKALAFVELHLHGAAAGGVSFFMA